MQDNGWDEKFVDHGWNEMRKLLDEEMPVGGFWLRRRRGWLAIAASMLLMIVAGGVLFLPAPPVEGVAVRQKAAAEETPAVSPPDAPAAPAGAGGPESPTIPEGSVAGNQLPPATAAASAATGLSAVPSRTLADRPGGQINRAAAPAEPKREATPAGADGERFGRAIAAGARPAEDVTDRQSALTDAARPAAPERLPENTATNLGEAVAVELPLPQTTLAGPVAALPERRTTGDIAVLEAQEKTSPASALLPDRWGFQGGTVAAGGATLNGATFGLAAEHRLGDSRWSVQSGLRYLYQNRDFAFQAPGQPESRLNADPNSADTTGGRFNTSSFNAEAFPIAAKTHSINVPVVVNYRVVKGLGLQMGLQMNYTLVAQRANSVTPPPPMFTGLAAADMKTVELVSTPASQAFANTNIQRWDLGLTGGVQYQPAQQLALQLRYNFGLTDLVRSDYYAAFNRFVSLGVTYYLH